MFKMLVGCGNKDSEGTEKAGMDETQDAAMHKALKDVAEKSEEAEYQTPKDSDSNDSEKLLEPQPAYQTPAKTAFLKLHGPGKQIMNSSDKAVGKLAQF